MARPQFTKRPMRGAMRDNPWSQYDREAVDKEVEEAWARDENVFMLNPADLMVATLAEADRVEAERPMVITSGVPCLDDVVDSIFGERFVVVLGRPSEGKSLLLYQYARETCRQLIERAERRGEDWETGDYVLFVGLEESAIEVAAMVRGDTISLADVAAGRRSPDDLRASAMQADTIPLFCIHDKRRDVWGSRYETATITPRAVWEEVMAMYRRTGRKPALVLFDYLQIMGGGDEEEMRAQVTRNARGCRSMSRRLRVPVMLASQAKRMVDYGNRGVPPIPDTGDSEWSSAAEQSADVLLSMTRPIRWPAALLEKLDMSFAPNPSRPEQTYQITPDLTLIQLLKQKGRVGRRRFMLSHDFGTASLREARTERPTVY